MYSNRLFVQEKHHPINISSNSVVTLIENNDKHVFLRDLVHFRIGVISTTAVRVAFGKFKGSTNCYIFDLCSVSDGYITLVDWC